MKQSSIFYYIALVTQLGLVMVTCILAGLFLGRFLDKILNTGGILTLIFLIFGLIGGFIGAYKLIESGGKKGG